MKRALVIIVAIVLLIGVGAWAVAERLMPPAARSASLDATHARLAEDFLDHLDAGRYEQALAMTTPQMRDGLGNGKLGATWSALPAQLGVRVSRSAVRGETVDGRPIVVTTLQFSLLALDARIVFDADHAISGFWIVPAMAPTATTPIATVNPLWQEVDHAVNAARGNLQGTLTIPNGDGPFPTVVLVHGSGPQDRDSTIGPNKPFADIAHGLADRGIAVLRYEKRTKSYPQQFAGNDFTIDDETVDDALAAVESLRGDDRVEPDRIIVAGHSLGALVAPRIGARDPRIAGLVLLAAPALPLEDTIVRQMRYIAAQQSPSDPAMEQSIAKLEKQRETIKQLREDALPVEPLMLNLPARYWLGLNTYDPVTTAATIGQPLLILQGGRDYQVTESDDFALWRNAFKEDKRATFKLYPTLGHTFMTVGERPAPKDYLVAGHVDAGVVADIAGWVNALPKR